MQAVIHDDAAIQQQRERPAGIRGAEMGTCGRITGTAAGSWGKSQVHYGNLLWNSGSGKFIEMLKCYICMYQTTDIKNNFWKNPSIKGTSLKTIILINMFMERYIHLFCYSGGQISH